MKKSILKALALLLLGGTLWSGDSYEHRVDEAKNALGANRCADSRDCDGKRTCSPHGWCQGTARPQTAAVVTVEVTRVVTVLVTPEPQRARTPIRHERLPMPRPGGLRPLSAAELTGAWRGTLTPKGRGSLTQLKLYLNNDDGRLAGQAEFEIAPKKPGAPTVSTRGLLTSRLAKGRKLSLRLVAGGQSRPYQLEGRADEGAGRISGSWRQGSQRGNFVLERTQDADGRNTVLSEGAMSVLNGRWVCEWQYNDGEHGPTPFTLDLAQDKGSFRGSSDEPNTFPKTKAKTRQAAILDGQLSPDGKLRWRKQYDGAEGVGYAVIYSGQMADDGQSAKGSWQIPGKNSGTWHMRREGAAAPQAPITAPTEAPTQAPVAAPTAAATAAPTLAPTEAPTAMPRMEADVMGTLGGPWSGMAHPKSGGLSPVTLNLTLAAGEDGSLKGHGIAIVRGGKPRERNVDLVEGSFKEDGSLKFSLHFSEPEEDDMNLNFRGQLHKNEKLIKGDWDHSGSGQGEFQLHYQEGGK